MYFNLNRIIKWDVLVLVHKLSQSVSVLKKTCEKDVVLFSVHVIHFSVSERKNHRHRTQMVLHIN